MVTNARQLHPSVANDGKCLIIRHRLVQLGGQGDAGWEALATDIVTQEPDRPGTSVVVAKPRFSWCHQVEKKSGITRGLRTPLRSRFVNRAAIIITVEWWAW